MTSFCPLISFDWLIDNFANRYSFDWFSVSSRRSYFLQTKCGIHFSFVWITSILKFMKLHCLQFHLWFQIFLCYLSFNLRNLKRSKTHNWRVVSINSHFFSTHSTIYLTYFMLKPLCCKPRSLSDCFYYIASPYCTYLACSHSSSNLSWSPHSVVVLCFSQEY